MSIDTSDRIADWQETLRKRQSALRGFRGRRLSKAYVNAVLAVQQAKLAIATLADGIEF